MWLLSSTKPTAENAGYSEDTVIISMCHLRSMEHFSAFPLSSGNLLEKSNEKKKQTVIIQCNGCLHPSTGALLISWEGVHPPNSPTKHTIKMHQSSFHQCVT